MDITGYSLEQLNDPTGIMVGDRYEFLLDVEVDEDDELYAPGGLEIRAIIAAEESGIRMPQYTITEKISKKVLEFGLEEEEEEQVLAFCREQL